MRGRKSRGERARAPAEEASVPRQKDGEERGEQEIALRGSGRVGDRVRGTTRLAAAERRSDALISEGPRQYGNVNEDMSAGQAERAEGERHACTGQT